VVEAVRVGGRVDFDSACFGVSHPTGSLCVCLLRWCRWVLVGVVFLEAALVHGSLFVVIGSFFVIWVV
jgi:hypothetical protein